MAALAEDWDAAIKEWNAGYIRKWMTRGVVGGAFERTIDQMETDPLFGIGNGSRGAVRATFAGDHDTAMQERRLMRVFSIMDPHWQPAYRGMPLRDKKAIGAWCRTKSRVHRSLAHRCLTHEILLAHPKKFARTLHDRTFRECGIYREHIQSHLDTGDLAPGGHTMELVMFQVLSILTGSRTTRELIVAARQDKKAMKVRWFSELVAQAANSAGCAVALGALAPMARKARSRRIAKIWVGVVGAVLIFIYGVINT